MAKKKETKKVELKEVSRVEINGNIIITYEDGSVKIIPAPIMLTADQASEIFGSEEDEDEEEEEESDDDEDEEESEDDEDEDDSEEDEEDEEESEDDSDEDEEDEERMRALTPETYSRVFSHSAVKRAKFAGLQRNLAALVRERDKKK